MSHLHVTVSKDLMGWAKAEAEAQGFASPEEYAAFLLQRAKDGSDLRAALLAGLPVPVSEFDVRYFDDLDRGITDHR
ncbi:MAG: hypothetical protein RL216_122 [Pseudomonadota bacterium]|jgi:hypothetical protein